MLISLNDFLKINYNSNSKSDKNYIKQESQLKKMHNLKAGNYWGQYEDLSQGYRLSVALRDNSEEGREELGYIGDFATR